MFRGGCGVWVGVDRGIGITLRVGWWCRVAGLVDGDRVMLVRSAVSMALGVRPRVVLGRGVRVSISFEWVVCSEA